MARRQLIDAWLRVPLALAALVGCGRATPPGTLVGESEHFRLYVDPDAKIPPGLEGTNALVALETEWADVHSMLQMPDGKITYYWLSPDHVVTACGEAPEAACTWEESLEIDSSTLPNAHELNHAYMFLRKQRKPIPFLAEGIAEAIGCGSDMPKYITSVPWAGIVGEASSSDLYDQGGIFVRYLIRSYGIDAFLRYYEQSPERRDPAFFAANFQSFWNLALDDVWTAIHTVPVGELAVAETKICPCSLPPLEAAGAVTNDPARAPYWPLPHTDGKTLALNAPAGKSIAVRDCAGIRAPLRARAVLARLDGSESRYVLPPLETATIDSYLADDCASAAPYPFSPLMTATGGYLIIGIPNPTSPVTLYLNLAASFSGWVRGGLQEICADCGFDQGTCQPLAPGATPTVQGPLYGKVTLRGSALRPTPDVVWNYIDIRAP